MKVLTVFSGHPKADNMFQMLNLLNKTPDVEGKICVAGWRRKMLDQILNQFEIEPDYGTGIMPKNQDVYDISSCVLTGLSDILQAFKPDWVLVPGDTGTACYYQQFGAGYVETALRTSNLYSPWLEEGDRILSDFHDVDLIEALDSLPFAHLTNQSHFVPTNLGDIQKETPSFGKPDLRMRNASEREEVPADDTVNWFDTSEGAATLPLPNLPDNQEAHNTISFVYNPYGDSKQRERIVDFLTVAKVKEARTKPSSNINMKTALAKKAAFNKVSVIGLGYIGLPTAAVIALRGIEVVGVDVNQHAVDTVNAGKIHIVEPDLDIVVRSVVTTDKLKATTLPQASDAFIIAVPTPFKNDHTPDLSYIRSAAESIAPFLEAGNLVILESTSPVGATEKMADWLKQARPDLSFPQDEGDHADIKIAHCPERVLPGHVLQELVANDRVIGGLSKACSAKAVELYQTFVHGDCIVTNARTAEMAKLTENSFRDVNIAFANELSIICDKLKINVWELIELANRHPRVDILKPGPGVGGHCIAVDPWFIVDSAPEEAKLIHQARKVNDGKPKHVISQVKRAADQLRNPVIACLGLAFKADIDDLRESPALQIVKELAANKVGEILAVEPNTQELPEQLVELGVVSKSLDNALENSNVVVILVDHREFKAMSKTSLNTKVVIDTRGVLS